MLIKSLPKIAARVLQNTKGLPPQYKQRLELIQEAYGVAGVEADFENWCEEFKDRRFLYPVSEYLKVIDSRLGSAPKEDEPDERIGEISALTYKLTRRPAPPKNVRELLAQFSKDEITSALQEYVEGIEERELAYAPKTFFVDGGCAAVISSRRQKIQDRENLVEANKKEKVLLDDLIAVERRKSEATMREIERQAAEVPATADELFGGSR